MHVFDVNLCVCGVEDLSVPKQHLNKCQCSGLALYISGLGLYYLNTAKHPWLEMELLLGSAPALEILSLKMLNLTWLRYCFILS